MAIGVGDKLPDATFKVRTADGLKDMTTAEIFGGKRVVLFAVPGAFTPTCQAKHLPSYLEHHAALTAKGVDRIACVAVNDAFVLDAWAKAGGVSEKVLMLSDGNLEFTRAAGMELDATVVGEGIRSQRYAALVRDGVVADIKIDEKPWLAEASSAESICAL